MKRNVALFASLLLCLVGCKEDFPEAPMTEPFLSLTTSEATVAVGNGGRLKVVLDRFVEGTVKGTLTSSSPALTIEQNTFSLDTTSGNMAFETSFLTNAVGDVAIEIASDYPGVRYASKTIQIKIVKPKITLLNSSSVSDVQNCLVGGEANFVITSDMAVVQNVSIKLSSSNPSVLTVPRIIILPKGSRKIVGKMKGVGVGEAVITATTSNQNVEINKKDDVELNKINVAVALPKVNISFAVDDQPKVGETKTFTIASDIEVVEDIVLTVSSNDESVITLPVNTVTILKGTNSITGDYSALKAGKATLTIASEYPNAVIDDTKKSIEVTVVE